MKNLNKFLLISVLLVLSLSVIGGTIAYAYIFRQRKIAGDSKVGHCQILSISNPTEENKINIANGESQNLNISLDLDCNINAVVRIKISPKFYDSFDRTVTLPNNIIYNTDSTQGTWIADDFNMCFYFDSTVKNIETLKFLSSISFNQENIDLYQNLYLSFVIDADILQTSAIDYNNHPWKDNAPSQWLEKVKSI